MVSGRTTQRVARAVEDMVDVVKGIRAGEKGLRINTNAPGELGNLALAFNDLLDADVRKEARLSEQMKFEILVKALNRTAIVSMTDNAGYFVNVNEQLCRVSGYSQAELTGSHMRVLESGAHSEEFTDKIWSTLKNGEVWTGEISRRRSDGGSYWVECSITPVKDVHGEQRFLHIEYDITSRKLMEQQVLQASKMVSLGEMAAGMAHEINNPAGMILLVVRRLKQALLSPAVEAQSAAKDLEKVEGAANRIVAIVKGLLESAHDGSGEPFVATSVRLLLEQALRDCRERTAENAITLYVGDHLYPQSEIAVESIPDIRCEVRATQMVQVLFSLLSNAIDAVEALPNRWIRVEIVSENRRVRISVTDSGSGIPLEIADKIMQPFFSTKEIGKGTGLGLSISRGFVEAHGGQLLIDRHSNNTRFVMEIPIKQSEIRRVA